MDFLLSDVHDDLAAGIDALLTKADSPAVARSWAAGDRTAAYTVFAGLADMGICGLMIGDDHGGAGAGAVEMVVAMEQLGKHGVPGPLAESLAVAPAVLAAADRPDELARIAQGHLVTIAAPPLSMLAADADTVESSYLLTDETLYAATAPDPQRTVDPARTVSQLHPGDTLATALDDSMANRAGELGALATAAQLLGLGDRMLSLASEYALARKQFGRQIGSFQAIKHHLADVAIALEMARPLVHGAAVGVDGGSPDSEDVSRDISAAKVAAADAAYLAARRGIQILGAIGYTAEHDLSIYLTKCRALIGAWGTSATHRARILERL